jgi:hypothetical protein
MCTRVLVLDFLCAGWYFTNISTQQGGEMYYFITVVARSTREIIATYIASLEDEAHRIVQSIGTGEGYVVFVTQGDPLS